MRRWKTVLWIVVLSFLSVSCGSRNTDPNQQLVGNPTVGQGVGNASGFGTAVGTGFGNGLGTGFGTGGGTGYVPPMNGGLPVVYGADGVYLGAMVAANADPDSICNPANEFGSQQSPNSIWSFGSAYGNPASPLSANNPSASQPPTVCYWDGHQVSNCFAYVSRNTNLGRSTYSPNQIRQTVCAGF